MCGYIIFEHSELEGNYFVVTVETLGCLFILHAWTVWLSWWVFKVDA